MAKTDKAEQDLRQLQVKYAPYFMIAAFSSITALLRYYLMPQWGWWHIPLLLYQVLVFIGFWHLIKYLNRRLNNFFPFERGPLKRIALQIFITVLVLSPLIVIAGYFARDYMPSFVNRQFQATMLLMFFAVIVMFNFAFYTFHFFDNWQASAQEKLSLQMKSLDLEKEKAEMQYYQLKNQVNPHYLFNMLTSLDGLVHTNPDLASDFIRHMAKVYRYVLQHKESEVVSVDEELEFIAHYIQLLQVRYGAALVIRQDVNEAGREKGIVMITLQMLIDNAIKHNVVQESQPLHIYISTDEQYLEVRNNKQLRKQIETSNGKGLEHLGKLYAFLTDMPVIVDESEDLYSIKIPLLPL